MENKQDPFDSIFEGIDLPEDFTAKLKTAFDSVVAQKVQEATKLGPVDTPPEAYAIGMSAAMKQTGDAPPLSKKTIRKAHDIAKGIMKTSGIKEAEHEMEMEDEDEMVTEVDEVELDPQELAKDPDIRKILTALKITPQQFAVSLLSSIKDVETNTIADDSFNVMISILSAIADDSIVAAKLAKALKDIETEKSSEEPAAAAPADNMKQVNAENAELEVYENVIASVDKYLTYVAESWLEDNTLAVEQGLKIEIMESFWSGLKTMFVEHNIAIPAETDVVDVLERKIVDLQSTISEEKTAFVVELTEQKQKFEEKLNTEINKSIVYKNRAEESTKKAIFETVSKELTLTQKERFAKLTESVTYESKKSYEEKLKDIVRNAFESARTKKKLTEDSMISVSDDTQIIADDPIINLYSQAISNNLKF